MTKTFISLKVETCTRFVQPGTLYPLFSRFFRLRYAYTTFVVKVKCTNQVPRWYKHRRKHASRKLIDWLKEMWENKWDLRVNFPATKHNTRCHNYLRHPRNHYRHYHLLITVVQLRSWIFFFLPPLCSSNQERSFSIPFTVTVSNEIASTRWFIIKHGQPIISV